MKHQEMETKISAGNLNAKVLIADDEPEVVHIMTLRLESRGYQVIPAYDGMEALERARKDKPDVIFLDIMMPRMDGWEVLYHLKEDPATRDIPVVVVTARTGDADKLRGYSGGAIDYITKPFDLKSLGSIVERILEPRERERQMLQCLELVRKLQLATIYDVTKAIISSLDLQEVLDIIAEKILVLFDLSWCAISLLDAEKKILRHSAARSLYSIQEKSGAFFEYPLELLGPENVDRLMKRYEYVKIEDPSIFAHEATEPLSRQKTVYIFPLVARDDFIGVLTLTKDASMFLNLEEIDLLKALCNEAAIAIENARLYENLRRDEEVHKELLHRVVTAQEQERRRLATELHDGIIQDLVSALYLQQYAVASLQNIPQEVLSAMEEVRRIIDSSITETRRIVGGLRPAMLDDLGLFKSMELYVKSCKPNLPFAIELQMEDSLPPLKPEAENAIYRIFQEGLSNMAKHSGCRQGVIGLRAEDELLKLTIQDDGEGFLMSSAHRDLSRCYGLLGMQERVEFFGGEMTIESGPGKGTHIFIEIPLKNIVRR